MSGQIAYMVGSISSLYPHGAAKKLRLVAIAAAKRSPTAPDLPTFAESGLPGYQVNGWNGIVAPQGTPAALVKKLNAEIVAGFNAPDVLERLRKQSIELAVGAPEQMARHIRTEFARYSKLIKSIGLKVD
jgi:tripartite-type tricarboxylate transporter receptor subunit TctC